MPPGIGYGFGASVPDRLGPARVNVPETAEEAVRRADFFQPEGDPYMYRVRSDGNLAFYNTQTGSIGTVSMQQVMRDNPEWVQQNLPGYFESAQTGMGAPAGPEPQQAQPAQAEPAQQGGSQQLAGRMLRGQLDAVAGAAQGASQPRPADTASRSERVTDSSDTDEPGLWEQIRRFASRFGQAAMNPAPGAQPIGGGFSPAQQVLLGGAMFGRAGRSGAPEPAGLLPERGPIITPQGSPPPVTRALPSGRGGAPYPPQSTGRSSYPSSPWPQPARSTPTTYAAPGETVGQLPPARLQSRGGGWYDVRLPDGTVQTVRGRSAAEALLQ